jgi:hypothetical protein
MAPIIDPASSLGVRALSVLDSATQAALAGQPTLDVPLLLAYRALADQDRRWMKLAVERLNIAIAGADALYSTRRFGLFGGLSGLGWVTEHVTRLVRRDQGESRINEDTDAALLLELQRGRWQSTCDLTTGLTGIGVYFLQRLPAPTATQGLELVLGHLEVSSAFEGAAGVAHGLAGMLYLLSKSGSRLLPRAIEALLASRLETANPCSWSEGELGVAAVCLQMACLQVADCQRLGSQLIERCIEVKPGGQELSLVNGAAGAAHLWNRISLITGDSRCREASLRWWEQTIGLYEKTTPAASVAGVGFLEGPAGLGLALTSALTPVEPDWDGLLCLSSRG